MVGLRASALFYEPVKAKALPPRGEAAASALCYEPVKAKTLPPCGEVAASALSYGLRYWRSPGHRVAGPSPRALYIYYGPRSWVPRLQTRLMLCGT